MKPERNRKPRPPLDEEAVERLALFYVGRYATTRAKLRFYLLRKLKERGWAGRRPPDFEGLAERLAELGYVDDRAFAAARTAALQRRGYGVRRIVQAMRAAGVEDDEARLQAEEGGWAAALRFARRKRIGPFAERPAGPEGRAKAFAALLRAGHPPDLARRLLDATPHELPDWEEG